MQQEERIIMSKRPSLAETMRHAVQSQPALLVEADQPQPRPARTGKTSAAARFHAATRAGKKKVTGNLPPSTHKLLKTLAVQRETTTEALLSEAVGDLLAKYNVRDKAA
jgi:hypothetical protein